MKMQSDVFYVYGFRDAAGKWRYIGQSVEPKKRRYRHENGRARGARLEFVILRKTSMADVNRIEMQIIRALKRRGEADLNQTVHAGRGVRKPMFGNVIRWVEGGIDFETQARAARHLGVTATTIRNALRRGGLLRTGVTLRE